MAIESDIKVAIKEKKIVMGTKSSFKNLKAGNLKMVIHASNCPGEIMSDLNHYGQITKVNIENSGKNSMELGELCGKPFKILILGIKK